MNTFIDKTRLELIIGDIAEQETEAIVTVAHWKLNKGIGTDGVIHSRGGPEVYEELKKIGGCPIGDAVITSAGHLKAKYIIHAVGPVWQGGEHNEDKLLGCAYQSALRRSAEYQLQSISFPSISTGAFCFPMRRAAPIALTSVIQFLKSENNILDLVRFVLYTGEDEHAYDVYAESLRTILTSQKNNQIS